MQRKQNQMNLTKNNPEHCGQAWRNITKETGKAMIPEIEINTKKTQRQSNIYLIGALRKEQKKKNGTEKYAKI